MSYESAIAKTKECLELEASGYYDWIHNEITKRSFHFRAKRFILSVIRQRELVIRKDRSCRDMATMLRIIDHLRPLIGFCPNKDVNVARMMLINENEIRLLIPAVTRNKRVMDFDALMFEAREINRKNNEAHGNSKAI